MKYEHVEFDLVRSAIYHGARMRFYDRLHRWFMFAVILTGTSAVASILSDYGVRSAGLALAAALLGAADIAFGFSGRARDHDFLRRQYYELLAKLVERQNDENIASIVHCDMLRLSAQEPPPLRALDAIAYNSALESLGRNPDERIPIKWRETLLKNILPYNTVDFAARKPKRNKPVLG